MDPPPSPPLAAVDVDGGATDTAAVAVQDTSLTDGPIAASPPPPPPLQQLMPTAAPPMPPPALSKIQAVPSPSPPHLPMPTEAPPSPPLLPAQGVDSFKIQTSMSSPRSRSMSGYGDLSQVQQFLGPRPASASGLQVRQLPTPAPPPTPPSQLSMPTESPQMPPPSPLSPLSPTPQPAQGVDSFKIQTSMSSPQSGSQSRSMSGVDLSGDLSQVQQFLGPWRVDLSGDLSQEPPKEEINEVAIDVESEEDKGGPVCEKDALIEQVKPLQNEICHAQNTKNEHYAIIEKLREEMEAEHQQVVYLSNQVDELKQQLQLLETEDKISSRVSGSRLPSGSGPSGTGPLDTVSEQRVEETFGRNALLNCALASLSLCVMVFAAVISIDFGSRSSNFKFLARACCIFGMLVGLGGEVAAFLAVRQGGLQGLPTTLPAFFVLSFLTSSMLFLFGCLAIISF